MTGVNSDGNGATKNKTVASARVRLVKQGQKPDRIFELNGFPATIGYDASCDIVLDMGGEYYPEDVDKRHAHILTPVDGQFQLVNLTNSPIKINDTPTDKLVKFHEGDRLHIGSYEIRIEIAKPSSALSGGAVVSAQAASPASTQTTALEEQPQRRTSELIGLELAKIPDTLSSAQPVEVSVFITNKPHERSKEGVQFKLDVIGPAKAYCTIPPGPRLSLGQKDSGGVKIIIRQLGDPLLPLPETDALPFSVRVTADVYGQEVMAEEMLDDPIRVQPEYAPPAWLAEGEGC